MEVVCVTSPCLHVPSCVPKNPCKKGVPATDGDRNIRCGLDDSCPEGNECNRDPFGRFAVCCPEGPIGYQEPCLDGTNCFCHVRSCFDDGMGYCDCPKSMGCEPANCCCRGSEVDQCEGSICTCLDDDFCEERGLAYCDPHVCGPLCRPERCCCRKPSPCGLPIVPGRCRAYFPRWAYDPQFGICVQFIYGGCGGNANNFETFAECRDACQDCPVFRCKECEFGNLLDKNGCRTCQCKEQCDLPQDVGPCDNDITRYWHNPESRQCERFQYGGCEGNANNFENSNDCFETCEPCPVPLCLPLEPCKFGFAKTEDGCQTCTCLVPDTICTQPAKPGPCYAHQTRYFYNTLTYQCEPFVYGGCAGNDNNFEDLADCQRVCGCSLIICAIFCEFGFVLDERGCATCECKESPCERGRPLIGDDGNSFFCGRGGQRCPLGYECAIDPADRFAVCCPTGAVGNYEPCLDGQNCICSLRYCVDLQLGYCHHPDGECDPKHCCCDGRTVNTCPGSSDCVCLRENDCEYYGMGYCTPSVCGDLCPPDRCCCRKQEECPLEKQDECLESCLEQGMNAVVGEECNGCPCIHPCATILCIVGSVCIGVPTLCIRPPCPLQGECIPTCELDIDPGPCEAAIRKWAFCKKSGTCVQFIYGGCEGNANRFDSYEDCRELCDPCPAVLCEFPCANGYARDCKGCQTCECIETCDLPAQPGPCKESLGRYWYNSKTSQCEKFTYGGCRGNANNFETLEACQAECKPCVYPECLKFIKCSLGIKRDRNGCPICECLEASDVCTMPPAPGPCKASFPRYFFNKKTQQCEQFVYGGCEGNENNFETIQDCQRLCVPNTCELPIRPGPCKAYFPRWGYDLKLHICRPFIYGGCLGNANNFESFEECRDSCHSCPQFKCLECVNGNTQDHRGCRGCGCRDTCDLPKDPGVGDRDETRYAHNPATRQCEAFQYGGSKGNLNSWLTFDFCFTYCRPCPVVDCLPGTKCPLGFAKTEDGCDTCTCLRKKDICSMDVEPGPCREYDLAFYFNTVSCKCEPFIYGGCAGNANRFETKKDCKNLCGGFRPGRSSRSRSSKSSRKNTKRGKKGKKGEKSGKKGDKGKKGGKKGKKGSSSSSSSKSSKSKSGKKGGKKGNKKGDSSSSSSSSSSGQYNKW